MDNPNLDEREIKVKFKDNLVDYEPSLTEDDVNSIESDDETVEDDFAKFFNTERSVFSDESVQSVINNLTAGEVILEEEETKHEDSEEETVESEESCEEKEQDVVFTEAEESFELPEDSEVEETKAPIKQFKNKRKFVRKRNSYAHNREVDCKSHCIESIDLGLQIKKLNIHEKAVVKPILKLQERKCCEDNNNAKNQNLPAYVGFRSEYGLSKEQLERRAKINQIIRMKEEKRQQVLREFRERKRQQNEQVFCQWLRNISKRKTSGKQKVAKETLSPKIINLPAGNKPQQQQKVRPVTAPLPPKSQFFLRQKRRPQTSPAYVYIQVPHNLLRHGISVGNVYVSLSGGRNKNIDIVAK